MKEQDEKTTMVTMLLVEPKKLEPILDNGQEVNVEMSLYRANAYYKKLASSVKPTQSIFLPHKNSGYIYDKASNSLVKNEPIVAEPVKVTAKKTAEPTV